MKRVVTILGYLEGLSFLILLGYAMPMKYLFDDPAPEQPTDPAPPQPLSYTHLTLPPTHSF